MTLGFCDALKYLTSFKLPRVVRDAKYGTGESFSTSLTWFYLKYEMCARDSRERLLEYDMNQGEDFTGALVENYLKMGLDIRRTLNDVQLARSFDLRRELTLNS